MKNILFIVIDCLGYNAISGDKIQNYPFLNYLFSEGAFFSQAISVDSTTSPSISSMLTGCYPFRHGVITLKGYYLRHKVPFLPEVLRDLGYNTYAEITGPLWPELGLSRGFDRYNYRDKKNYLLYDWGKNLKNKFASHYFKEPWFIFLHLWELHRPRQILPTYNKNTYGAPYERSLKSLDHALEILIQDSLDISKTIIIFTGDHGEHIENSIFDRKYKALIIKIYNQLNRYGLLENKRSTIYKNYFVGHGFSLLENLIRIPLLLIDKERIKGPLEIDFQISHVDVLPTLLSLLKVKEFDMKIDGQTVLPYIMKGEVNSEHVAYMQACGIMLPEYQWLEGIRYKGFKYIRYQKDPRLGEWLYNIENDPDERKNIKDKYLLGIMRYKLDQIKKDSSIITEEKMGSDEIRELTKKLKELGYM